MKQLINYTNNSHQQNNIYKYHVHAYQEDTSNTIDDLLQGSRHFLLSLKA